MTTSNMRSAYRIHRDGNWTIKRDRPGYALSGLTTPLQLSTGAYRVTFVLRRGNYPKKGLLYKTYSIFRLEVWDVTDKKLITHRELQVDDFDKPNKFEERWVEFGMKGRENHAIEPRIYWSGLTNAEVKTGHVTQFPPVSSQALEEKALRLENLLQTKFLENGFVVSRKPNGEADEIGDATTYTSYLASALAWKYAVTRDSDTYHSLMDRMKSLHQAIKGTQEKPLLVRFVDEDSKPFPNSPSKDVYMSYFFAHAVAAPYITDNDLIEQMKIDVEKLGSRFLVDGLAVKNGRVEIMSLTPYLTEQEVRSGVRKLLEDEREYKEFLHGLRKAKKYLPWAELWPGMNKVIAALKARDEDALVGLTVPTMNGMVYLIERARDLLKEQYRQDLFPARYKNNNYPGKKLEVLLTTTLSKLPPEKAGRRFNSIRDLSVLASNATISLHIVKTAHTLTRLSQFSEYYNLNLFTQDALLQTAMDWFGFDENVTRLTAGNPAANNSRRGILGPLAVSNLIALEKNPTVKDDYRQILDNWWETDRHEDNPLTHALVAAYSEVNRGEIDLVLRALDLYPENRTGFGRSYWERHGKDIAQKIGGGTWNNYSREPLPVSHRPKDSFLWQRNSRRLEGDIDNEYPPTDYLFVYWFCRAHNLIP
jgi:hypothetical protein